MREIKRKVLVIAVALMAVAILATPVFAAPTAGQKKAVTINWSNWTVIAEDPTPTPGGILLNTIEGTWDVEIVVTDGPTYTGTSATTRYLTAVPQKDGVLLVIKEEYEISVNEVSGGFEGSSLILIKNWIPPSGPFEKAKAHGLLHGTGAFEGQTINAGHTWVPPGPIVWTGYILKP